jgi:agmatinase
MRPILLGGEHTITIGALLKMVEKYPDLVVLQLDAHTDYREEYLGESISHATTMRRVADFISPDRLFRLGVRAGTRDEFVKSGIELPLGHEGGVLDVERVLKSIPKQAPLYVTLDLDVFDPSLMPGVGNPEPNGLTYREFIHLIRGLVWHKLVGFDVVELAPQYDPSGESAIVAASAVRDLMLCMM